MNEWGKCMFQMKNKIETVLRTVIPIHNSVYYRDYIES